MLNIQFETFCGLRRDHRRRLVRIIGGYGPKVLPLPYPANASKTPWRRGVVSSHRLPLAKLTED